MKLAEYIEKEIKNIKNLDKLKIIKDELVKDEDGKDKGNETELNDMIDGIIDSMGLTIKAKNNLKIKKEYKELEIIPKQIKIYENSTKGFRCLIYSFLTVINENFRKLEDNDKENIAIIMMIHFQDLIESNKNPQNFITDDDYNDFKKNINNTEIFLDFSIINFICNFYKINITLIHLNNGTLDFHIIENEKTDKKTYVIFLKSDHFEPVSYGVYKEDFKTNILNLKKLEKQYKHQRGGKKTKKKNKKEIKNKKQTKKINKIN